MGRIIQIDTSEVLKNIQEGNPVFMLIRCTEETTFADAMDAEAFVTVVESINVEMDQEAIKQAIAKEFANDKKSTSCLTEEQEDALDSYVINTDDENIQDALPPDKPDKYPAKKKKKKSDTANKVDHGRIVALRRGGRSVSWIADDCGCSQQTVYYHLKMEGLK